MSGLTGRDIVLGVKARERILAVIIGLLLLGGIYLVGSSPGDVDEGPTGSGSASASPVPSPARARQTACHAWLAAAATSGVDAATEELDQVVFEASTNFTDRGRYTRTDYFLDTVDADRIDRALGELAGLASQAALTPGLDETTFDRITEVLRAGADVRHSVVDTKSFDFERLYLDVLPGYQDAVTAAKQACGAS